MTLTRVDTAIQPASEDPRIDVPPEPAWSSDLIALLLRDLGIEYVALTPGASYRGLHDSLVNLLGNRAPQMLLSLHEEHAVAIAHGYAKATGRAMGAIVHSNVGLLHASMALYNAYCDHAPLVLLGATGPLDAAHRRPWIDSVHTFSDQAALVRQFVKWDDQPTSLEASLAAVVRGHQVAHTHPQGPVYVCFDSERLEDPIAADAVALPQVGRHVAPARQSPDPASLQAAAGLLIAASRPVILVGRSAMDSRAWQNRVRLAELLGARVVTDLKQHGAFPTAHPLHCRETGIRLSADAALALAEADVVLSLDWLDIGGTLRTAGAQDKSLVHASSEIHRVHGFRKDDYWPAATDVHLASDPDLVVAGLLEELADIPTRREWRVERAGPSPYPADDPLDLARLAATMRSSCGNRSVSLVRGTLNWPVDEWGIEDAYDYLGMDGGGGLGSGPGTAVGSALALRGSGRLAIGVLGDGDYAMGVTALWSAVHYRIPLLIVVANNLAYMNDEVHQDRMAIQRRRPRQNRSVGTRIDDPALDICALAEAQGARGFGSVTTVGALREAMAAAVACVEEGGVAIIDARIRSAVPRG